MSSFAHHPEAVRRPGQSVPCPGLSQGPWAGTCRGLGISEFVSWARHAVAQAPGQVSSGMQSCSDFSKDYGAVCGGLGGTPESNTQYFHRET